MDKELVQEGYRRAGFPDHLSWKHKNASPICSYIPNDPAYKEHSLKGRGGTRDDRAG